MLWRVPTPRCYLVPTTDENNRFGVLCAPGIILVNLITRIELSKAFSRRTTLFLGPEYFAPGSKDQAQLWVSLTRADCSVLLMLRLLTHLVTHTQFPFWNLLYEMLAVYVDISLF